MCPQAGSLGGFQNGPPIFFPVKHRKESAVLLGGAREVQARHSRQLRDAKAMIHDPGRVQINDETYKKQW